MPTYSRLSLSLIIFVIIFALSFSLSVRSEYDDSSVIQLPVDDDVANYDGGDFCAGALEPGSCPVKCFRTDPVCGVDGVTYWCGCGDAICAGTRVAKLGFCEVGNGGSGSLWSGTPLGAYSMAHIAWILCFVWPSLSGTFIFKVRYAEVWSFITGSIG